MLKNVASQKLTVLAFADAGHATLDAGERVTGDAANITCKVEQDDDGVQSATNDVNPTEVEDGQYRFDLTQAETNGDKLTFYPESSTAGVQVVALPSSVIYTRPQYFADLTLQSDGEIHVDATKVGGQTATATASVDFDDLATIEAVTTAQGGTGTGLTAIPWNASWDAEVESEVNDALVALHLDHLLAVDYDPASPPGTSTALLNELIESDAGVSRFTVNALENAPSGSGASAETIADAVWDEARAGHTTAGSFGEGIASVQGNVTGSVASVTGAINTAAGTITTLDALDTAQDTQHSNTQTSISNLNDPTAAAIADAVCDEVITGAEHNVNNSLAKFVREAATATVGTTGTLQSATATTAVLASGAITVNDYFNGERITIIEGTGAGQSRLITDSTASSDTVTVGHAWTTTPDNTSIYAIMGAEVDVRAVAEQTVNATSQVDFDDLASILVDTGTTIPATLTDMQGSTFNTSTDSLEAIRNRGDAAWSAAGSSPILIQNTTIATLTSQTVFTLTDGSSDDDAYNGLTVIITDQATNTQKAVGTISDYSVVGGTKTVTLVADPEVFTMAAGDTIDIVATVNGAVAGSATGVGWLG